MSRRPYLNRRRLTNSVPDAAPAPRPSLGDHLQVAWLVLCSLGALVPLLVYTVCAPVLAPLLRARLRRRLQADPPPPSEPQGIDAAAWSGRRIFVVAGEASGDRLAARVVAAARTLAPEAAFEGYGGPALERAGVHLHRNLMSHAVMGVIAVLRTLPFWWRLCAETLARFRVDPPDLCLTVDFPGLNVRIARWARARGVRTVHLVAPQLWAHQPWRVVRWRRAVDHILATFPFEATLLRRSGIRTSHVGHPLFEAPLAPARTPEDGPGDGPHVVEVWPGSRRREIRRHAPMLTHAMARIREQRPDTWFVVRLAHASHEADYRRCAGSDSDAALSFSRTPDTNHPVLAALVCSGTATAQLAADLVPMIAFYHLAPWTRVGAWLYLNTPWFLLPNVIVGRTVIAENLFSRPVAGDRIGQQLVELVRTPARWQAHRDDLRVVRERLEVAGVADRAARALLAPCHSPASASR